MRLALIVIAVTLMNVAWAQPPKPKGTAGKSPTVHSQGAKPANTSAYPTEEQPFPVRLVPSAQDNEHAGEREKATDDFNRDYLKTQQDLDAVGEIQKWAPWAAAGLSLIAIVITGVGLWYIIGTYKETRKTAQAARDSADAFMISERPNLVIESVKIAGMKDTPFNEMTGYDDNEIFTPVGSCRIKNYGKSPAWISAGSFDLIMAEHLPQIPRWPEDSVEWLDSIPPNTDIARVRWLPGGKDDFRGKITKAQRDQIRRAELNIFFIGRITYRDQFGKHHIASGAWEVFIVEYDVSEEINWEMIPCGPKSYWEYT